MKKTVVFGLLVIMLAFGFNGCDDGNGNNDIIINGWKVDPYAHPNSTVNMEINGDKLTFTGSVGFRNDNPNVGSVDIGFIPNSQRLAALKNADGISFNVRVDSRPYSVEVRISDIVDWDHFNWNFQFESDSFTETRVTIPFEIVRQMGWGEEKEFNKNNIERITLRIKAEIQPGQFEITIWDLETY
jgi:hypothetical protein